MKFQFYHEKLINSEEYQKFLKDNPKAYPCSGFFIVDKEKDQNVVHFDFYLPDEKKIFSFDLSNGVKLIPIDNLDKKVPEKIQLNHTFDLADYEKIIEKEIEKEKVKGTTQKFLFSLQRKDKKDYLVATVFLSNLALIKTSINLETNKIEDFEKKSFFDLIKVVSRKKKD